MTPAEALLVFTTELTAATRQLGSREPAPPVRLVELSEAPRGVTVRTRAYTVRTSSGRYVALMAHSAAIAGWMPAPHAWLRCMARHEAIHVVEDHRPKDEAESEASEAVVALVIRSRWNETDPTCDARRSR